MEMYLSANETQALKDEYCRAPKILDSGYKQVTSGLDDIIKTFQNLHAEDQHQLKELFQKY
jgi:hypothetical protein